MVQIITPLPPDHAADLLRTLRTALSDAAYSHRLRDAVAGGYTLIGAQQGGALRGVLGYRLVHDLCWGKTLYVDDLVIDPDHRGHGLGGALLDAARDCAKIETCDHIRLCSGVTRTEAHRFYRAHGYDSFSTQFVLALKGH